MSSEVCYYYQRQYIYYVQGYLLVSIELTNETHDFSGKTFYQYATQILYKKLLFHTKNYIYQKGASKLSVRKSKRREDSPMPATGAGLIRFYSESDSPGLKMGPYWTVVLAVAFVAIILIINIILINA